VARSRFRRHGMVALEVVMTAAVCIPGAAMMYYLYESVMNNYAFMLGGSLGMPLM